MRAYVQQFCQTIVPATKNDPVSTVDVRYPKIIAAPEWA